MAKVKKRAALLLRRWPSLYDFVARVYFALQPVHLRELVFGTKAREKDWAVRHLRKGNDWDDAQHTGEDDEWIKGYWDSRNHRHRSFLLERIFRFSPISSILEIGCNCGPNLSLIAKKFPSTEVRGIDVNPMAIQKGNELLAQEGISNVKLSVGKASELAQFQDKSFDIVFTDAVLIYIGPDKIKEVVREMLRLTRRALILVERHCFEPQNGNPNGLGVYRYGCWERDYLTLLKQFVPEKHISITKITEDLWPEERWQKSGAIIEVIV